MKAAQEAADATAAEAAANDGGRQRFGETPLTILPPEERPHIAFLVVPLALLLAAIIYGTYRTFFVPKHDPFHKPNPYLAPVPEPEPHRAKMLLQSAREEPVGLLELLREWFIEPFLTAVRFLHLGVLFVPVMILAPVTFLGKRERLKNGQKGDRAGALWWYRVLVKQMERAGPSFIKVSGRVAVLRGDPRGKEAVVVLRSTRRYWRPVVSSRQADDGQRGPCLATLV